jgi:hypothetical protein
MITARFVTGTATRFIGDPRISPFTSGWADDGPIRGSEGFHSEILIAARDDETGWFFKRHKNGRPGVQQRELGDRHREPGAGTTTRIGSGNRVQEQRIRHRSYGAIDIQGDTDHCVRIRCTLNDSAFERLFEDRDLGSGISFGGWLCGRIRWRHHRQLRPSLSGVGSPVIIEKKVERCSRRDQDQ